MDGRTTILEIDKGWWESTEPWRVPHQKHAAERQAGHHLEICLQRNSDERWVRTLLACLKVGADQVRQPAGSMSGGERAKVALAALLVGGFNLLLLDEPTNHLDIEAREALEGTLAQYPGTIVFVSHDRYFVETLANEAIELGKEAACREEDTYVQSSLVE